MKKYMLLVLLLVLVGPTKIFPQWSMRNNGIPTSVTTGMAIDACDENTAIISVNYYSPVFMTTDGGANWFSRILMDNSIGDVDIFDKDYVWVGSSNGNVFGSTDGGINWTKQYDNNSETGFINYIEMFTKYWGVAMGDGPSALEDPAAILKTQSGGGYWHYVNNQAFGGHSGDMWRRVDFVDMNIGYFYESGINPQKLYKTTDGGYTWDKTNFDGALQLLKFYDQNIGIAYGNVYNNNDYDNPVKTIYRTTDGGISFDSFIISTEGYPNDFEFLPGNPNFIWFATLSRLYYSTDMGETWTEHYLVAGELRGRDIVFTDDNHGWLLCDNGRVYYTENNGGIVTDVDDDVSQVPAEFQLMQNYPNPFNPSTVISFQLAVNSHSVLKVFDILGNEVATLVDEQKPAGIYQVEFDGTKLTSGIYFYTLQAGDFAAAKKFVLLK